MNLKIYILFVSSVITISIFFLFTSANSQNNVNQKTISLCKADFSYMIEKVQQNYSGYSDKVNTESKQKLNELTEKLYFRIKTAANTDSCTVILKQWISFFNDDHLQLGVKNSNSSNTNKTAIISKHSWRPSLLFCDDETACLHIPSFELRYKQALDSLIDANMSRLLTTPKMVIDISGNSGGGDPAFDKLIQFFYTSPIKVNGAEILASGDNISHFKSLLDKKEIPESTKEFIRKLVMKMSQSKGEFVCMINDTIVTYKTVNQYPKDVAIIVDGKVASSAEQFLLYARQSSKVIIFGSNTYGCLDYGNISPIALPSGYRTLWIPTTRRSWLPDFSVDKKGIEPDVKIPDNIDNKLAYILGYYAGMSKKVTSNRR